MYDDDHGQTHDRGDCFHNKFEQRPLFTVAFKGVQPFSFIFQQVFKHLYDDAADAHGQKYDREDGSLYAIRIKV